VERHVQEGMTENTTIVEQRGHSVSRGILDLTQNRGASIMLMALLDVGIEKLRRDIAAQPVSGLGGMFAVREAVEVACAVVLLTRTNSLHARPTCRGCARR